jgi:hypothetical protein
MERKGFAFAAFAIIAGDEEVAPSDDFAVYPRAGGLFCSSSLLPSSGASEDRSLFREALAVGESIRSYYYSCSTSSSSSSYECAVGSEDSDSSLACAPPSS